MILYHGSNKKFNHFRTPTGISKMDVLSGGVVYLTDNIKIAEKYAGQNGYIYIVDADAVSYKKQRQRQGLPKKKNKFLKGVYVSLPEKIKMIKRREL